MSTPAPQEVIKQQFINQILKVTTKNGRVFTGRLVSIDFRSNLILHETIASIDATLNCQLNQRLDNSLDYKMVEVLDKECPQWNDEKRNQYLSKHYYFGAVMISGGDIQTVLLNKDKKFIDKQEQ